MMDFIEQFNQEKQKHECTKRALDKAIKLANILLEEITSNRDISPKQKQEAPPTIRDINRQDSISPESREAQARLSRRLLFNT